jgi:hypothetical protein
MGVDPARIIFAPFVSWQKNVERGFAGDLFLDTPMSALVWPPPVSRPCLTGRFAGTTRTARASTRCGPVSRFCRCLTRFAAPAAASRCSSLTAFFKTMGSRVGASLLKVAQPLSRLRTQNHF